MSARTYRDARLEVKPAEDVLQVMEHDLARKIAALKAEIQEAQEAQEEYNDRVTIVIQEAKDLPDIFMVKVDNDLVFRLARNQRIQVIKITEE